MKIVQTLQKWGNSNGVRLPKKVLEMVNLEPNQKLMVTIHDGAIVLTPIKEKVTLLERMLEGVVPKDIQGELEWGLEVGNELYE